MSLGHVDTLLSDFLENHLQKSYMEKIKSHLVFCNACRHALQDLEKNKAALGSLALMTVPAGLEDRIIATLKTQAAPAANLTAENTPNNEPVSPPRKPIEWTPVLKLLITVLVVSAVYAAFQFVPKSEIPTPVSTPVEEPVVEPVQPIQPTDVAPVQTVTEKTPVEPPPAITKPVTPAAQPPKPESVSTGDIDVSGTSSGQDQPLETVIRSESAWKDLWAKHTKNITPPPGIPVIDFSKNDVIAVFAGNQPNGGYSIRIASVEETTWEGLPARIVHLKTSEPSAGSFNTMAISQPYHIKTTPKITGKSFFRKNR